MGVLHPSWAIDRYLVGVSKSAGESSPNRASSILCLLRTHLQTTHPLHMLWPTHRLAYLHFGRWIYYGFKTRYLKSGLLKKEANIGVSFLQMQCSVIVNNNKAYSRDTGLLSWILRGCAFDVMDIMHSTTIRSMLQWKDCIKHRRMQPVLILPFIIVLTCLTHGVELASMNTIARRMELIYDTTF